YAMQPPTQSLKNLLTQTITISRRTSAMVRCSVAFNAKKILARPRRIDNSEIDAEALYTHLRLNVISGFTNGPCDRLLKWTFESVTKQCCEAELACFCEV